jgi:hypothetical protein
MNPWARAAGTAWYLQLTLSLRQALRTFRPDPVSIVVRTVVRPDAVREPERPEAPGRPAGQGPAGCGCRKPGPLAQMLGKSWSIRSRVRVPGGQVLVGPEVG